MTAILIDEDKWSVRAMGSPRMREQIGNYIDIVHGQEVVVRVFTPGGANYEKERTEVKGPTVVDPSAQYIEHQTEYDSEELGFDETGSDTWSVGAYMEAIRRGTKDGSYRDTIFTKYYGGK